jgi:hypothetical protein
VTANGSDNTSASALLCRLVPLSAAIPDPWTAAPEDVALAPATWESEMSEASKALLQTTPRSPRTHRRRRSTPTLSRAQWFGVGAIGLLLVVVCGLLLLRPAAKDDRPTPPSPSELPVPGP